MEIYFDEEELQYKLENDDNKINIKDTKYNNFIEIKLNINNELIFKCNSTKNNNIYIDKFIKYMEDSYLNKNLNNSRYIIKNRIDFPIKSDNDESLYLVSIYNNELLGKIDFSCSCGLKFKVGYRRKCKHIKNTINQIKICNVNEKIKNNNISNLISNLKIES